MIPQKQRFLFNLKWAGWVSTHTDPNAWMKTRITMAWLFGLRSETHQVLSLGSVPFYGDETVKRFDVRPKTWPSCVEIIFPRTCKSGIHHGCCTAVQINTESEVCEKCYLKIKSLRSGYLIWNIAQCFANPDDGDWQTLIMFSSCLERAYLFKKSQ